MSKIAIQLTNTETCQVVCGAPSFTLCDRTGCTTLNLLTDTNFPPLLQWISNSVI